MNKFCRAFLTVCLLVSLLSAAVLLGCRFSAEWNDRAVLAVMSDEDVAALAAASGVEETVSSETIASPSRAARKPPWLLSTAPITAQMPTSIMMPWIKSLIAVAIYPPAIT